MIRVGRLVLPPVGHGPLAEAKQVRIKGSAKTLRIRKCIAVKKQRHLESVLKSFILVNEERFVVMEISPGGPSLLERAVQSCAT